MAAVSSVLVAPVNCVLAGPSRGTDSASPRRRGSPMTRSSSCSSGGADVAALALPLVSIMPRSRAQRATQLFSLNSLLQTPRSTAASLAATAAADAATAAAAAARAAAVAAAAAGAVSSISRDSVGQGLAVDSCRVDRQNLPLGSANIVFNYQDAQETAMVVSGSGAPYIFSKGGEGAAAPAATDAMSGIATIWAKAEADRRVAYSFSKPDDSAGGVGSISGCSNAELSLACRPLHKLSGKLASSSVTLTSSSVTTEDASPAAVERERDAVRINTDATAEPRPSSAASNVQTNEKRSLPRTLSCFSSFCSKYTAKSTCDTGAVSGSGPFALENSKKGSSSSRGERKAGSSPTDITDRVYACTNNHCRPTATTAICGEKSQQEKMFARHVEDAIHGSALHKEGCDASIYEQGRPDRLFGRFSADTGDCGAAWQTGDQSLLHLSSIAAADAGGRTGVDYLNKQQLQSDTSSSSSSVHWSNQGCRTSSSSSRNNTQDGCSRESSSYSLFRLSRNHTHSNVNPETTCTSSSNVDSSLGGSYRSHRSYNSSGAGKEGNIFVLGSARQVTPESSRISSRMSCGGDDACLGAHIDFLPVCAAAATERKEEGSGGCGGRGAAGDVTGRLAASAADRRVAMPRKEMEGLVGFATARGDNDEKQEVCQQPRGPAQQSTSIYPHQKQQQYMQDANSQRLQRCLSMPGELHAPFEGGHKAQGLPGALTPREVSQLHRQELQRKAGEAGQVKKTQNVLTSKFLLANMKLDLLKLHKAEKNNCPHTASRQLSAARTGALSQATEYTCRESNSEGSSSVRSSLSGSCFSSRPSVVFNSKEAAASVVALTGSSAGIPDPRALDGVSSSATPSSSQSSSSSSSRSAPSSLFSLASSLACKGKNLLSSMLPSLVLIVEPPAGDNAASPPAGQATEETETGVEEDLHSHHYAGSRAANTAAGTAPQQRYFAKWGYHGLSPLDAIDEAEEAKVAFLCDGDNTHERVASILIQGADEVELLRGTSLRRNPVVRHSLESANALWEKILSCCW